MVLGIYSTHYAQSATVASEMSNRWQPTLNAKQWELAKLSAPDTDYEKHVLVSGPRFSSKTIGCLNVLAQHAWDVKGGRIGFVTPTNTTASDGGVWTDLVEFVLPQWIQGGFGMQWATPGGRQGDKQKGLTKKLFCAVTNRHGSKTEIILESLQHENQVESLFKGKSYSMIYITELSKFKERKTYDTISSCLRKPGVPQGQHLLLMDTNPADEGPFSWIYKHFYEFRRATGIDPIQLPIQKQLRLLEIFV